MLGSEGSAGVILRSCFGVCFRKSHVCWAYGFQGSRVLLGVRLSKFRIVGVGDLGYGDLILRGL